MSEKIRAILKSGDKMQRLTQFFLFNAARVELLEEITAFQLTGGIPILDRWWFSTFAYQGALGVPAKLILDNVIASSDVPYNTQTAFYLHVPLAVRRSRLAEREQTAVPDTFDAADDKFQRQTVNGYLELVRAGMMQVVDAGSMTLDAVVDHIVERTLTFLNGWIPQTVHKMLENPQVRARLMEFDARKT